MFGGTLIKNSGVDFGERMLNAAVTQSIRHLFTRSDEIDVQIRCQPASKLLQGEIDGFKMSGRRLLIRKDFWVEEMSFETDAVSIDFGSAITGKLRLRQPTNAIARVVLTEAGINRAFTAELVTQRLQNLDAPELTNLSGGEPVSFSDVKVALLPGNQVRILAKVGLPNGEIPVSLIATLAVERRRRVVFAEPQFVADQVPENLHGVSRVLTNAFADILNNMVDLDRFDLDGVMMRINRLETHGDQLIFSGYAQIDHFPKQGQT